MQELISMYLAFFKVGILTFGGGYAMLPILQREVVDNHHWATEEELMDYYAIGQCTPGVIAVNTATFIGKKYRGVPGAILATLGVITPSLFIITAIAALITQFADIAWVRHAMGGIRICVCVFIFNAVWKLWKSAVVDKATQVLYLLLFLAALFFDISPILAVVIAGVAGNLLTSWGVRGK